METMKDHPCIVKKSCPIKKVIKLQDEWGTNISFEYYHTYFSAIKNVNK